LTRTCFRRDDIAGCSDQTVRPARESRGRLDRRGMGSAVGPVVESERTMSEGSWHSRGKSGRKLVSESSQRMGKGSRRKMADEGSEEGGKAVFADVDAEMNDGVAKRS
jgi:hypothetical protein